jgi:hypothetical protein
MAEILLFASLHGQAGLIQHLDANMQAGVIVNEEGEVVKWVDQGSFANDAVALEGLVYKVEEEGLNWLDFGSGRNMLELFSNTESDSWLDQSEGTGGFCVILSLKISSVLDNWNDIIGNSSVVSEGFGMRYSSSGSIQVYLGGKSIGGTGVVAGDVIIMALNYSVTESKLELWDSKSKATNAVSVPTADFSLSNPVTIGSTNNPARYFQGYIGEVKIYNTNLSVEEFQSEQDQFFLKWIVSGIENDPPSPNPATFSISPQGVSGTVISMTATEGFDENGPVEYLFTEISGNTGGSSSGWQTNPNYRDGDLLPETEYTYTVTMRDALLAEGQPSQPMSASTLTYTEPGTENELEYGAFYGYQGWHYAEGDGRVNANDWVHWFNNNIPDAENIHGDMWPDLREYDPDRLYDTQMTYPDGETAALYSCFDYSTIDLHVKWMSEYGIKGCAVQRFTSSIDKPNKLEQGDKKIRDIMTACEKYGVKFWIMHDSGQGDEDEYNRITNDWKHLVENLDILQSPAYTWQNGLPVYGLWGIGVNTRQWQPDDAARILDFFQAGDEEYRTYVVGGVPVNWRTNPPQGWGPVFDRLDMISPWRTIFNDPDQYKLRMQADFAYCNERGIDYNPVVSPGASTKHLRFSEEMRNWKPRNGGHFLWKQAYEVCAMGSKFMYVAMFDEVDEGTAMYKLVETEEDLPVGADQVPLNEDGYDLPSDWYLQIGTEIQKMIEGTLSVTPTMPLTPQLMSLEERLPENSIRIYPVPAREKIYLSGTTIPSRVKLTNVSGSILFEGQLDVSSIHVGHLPPGFYFLNIDGKAFRFVKE